MTKLYYNIIKKPKTSEQPFAIYVSENPNTLVRDTDNPLWDKVEHLLGKEDKACEWYRYIINIRNIISVLDDMGCERNIELIFDGEKLIRY